VRILREELPLIQVRSDVERKRLFGLGEAERSASAAYGGIYTEEATRRTYQYLRQLAEGLLEAGYDACIDATFLQGWQRALFASLAQALGCPFRILVPEAPDGVLRERVRARHAAGTDASEADLQILEAQLGSREPLDAAEVALALRVDTVQPPSLAALLAQLGD
jgi:predicted kinase